MQTLQKIKKQQHPLLFSDQHYPTIKPEGRENKSIPISLVNIGTIFWWLCHLKYHACTASNSKLMRLWEEAIRSHKPAHLSMEGQWSLSIPTVGKNEKLNPTALQKSNPIRYFYDRKRRLNYHQWSGKQSQTTSNPHFKHSQMAYLL